MSLNTSLPNLILLALEKSIDGYLRLEDFAFNSHWYVRGYDRPLQKTYLSKALKRLREKGFISLVDEKAMYYSLTDKGKTKLVSEILLSDEKFWDKKWRIICFDIPEEKKLVREILRKKLKSWGFSPVQKSLWVTKRNCTDQLRAYVRQIGISDWVKVFESENVDF